MATTQNNTMYGVSIQFKYKNANDWAGTEVLLAGEIGLEIDTKKYKLGDGSTQWSELAYYSDPIVSDAVDALAGRLDSAESSITTLQGNVTQAQSDITSLQGKDTEHDTAISTLQGKDTEHESRMTTIEAKDTAQDSRLDTLEGITVISANPAPNA